MFDPISFARAFDRKRRASRSPAAPVAQGRKSPAGKSSIAPLEDGVGNEERGYQNDDVEAKSGEEKDGERF